MESSDAHLTQRRPKSWSHGLRSVCGFRKEVQLIPQVQSGHCVSARNRADHSRRCCCCLSHDSFNKQEHFEPIWLGLSNKSKHGQRLIDYIFREHDKESCFSLMDGLYLVIHCLATYFWSDCMCFYSTQIIHATYIFL